MPRLLNEAIFCSRQKATGAFVRAHSPQLFGPAQDAKRAADIQYEQLTNRSPDQIEGLIASNSNPAFQAEIIRIMKNDKSLGGFMNTMGISPSANLGWLGSVKSAINAADSSGVLTHAQASHYRQLLGFA